jgi:general secretion pathway protein A
MSKTLLALFGLKWNPFTSGVPTAALHVTPRVEFFRRRVTHLAAEGGFALVTGDPGTGKSAALRMLAEHLADQRDIKVGMISRPQANIADFYREMGDLFGVELQPHNRWAGTKILRQRWQDHIDSALSRPVLIVDEAQEMQPSVLSELRILSSTRLDSQILLTVVLAGDARLNERLRSDEFLPLESRIRVRLQTDRATTETLQACLRHLLAEAGAPALITPEAIVSLCEHAQGNLRSLMIMADGLLVTAAERELPRIDEALLLDAGIGLPQPKVAGRRR